MASALVPKAAYAGIPTIDLKQNAGAFGRMAAEWMAAFSKLQQWRDALSEKLDWSYETLDEAERLRRAVESNQIGQLTGFGQRVVDMTGFESQLDSLTGEWKDRAKRLQDRFLVELPRTYTLELDPRLITLYKSAHTVNGSTLAILGKEIDAALGNDSDDWAAMLDGDITGWEPDIFGPTSWVGDSRIGSLISRIADEGMDGVVKAELQNQLDSLYAARSAWSDSVLASRPAGELARADSLACRVDYDVPGAAQLVALCRANRRLHAQAPGWLQEQRAALRSALEKLAPQLQWKAGSARQVGRWAGRAEDRLEHIDRIADELAEMERLGERVSTGRGAQLQTALSLANLELALHTTQANALSLEAAATKLAASRRADRMNDLGAVLNLQVMGGR